MNARQAKLKSLDNSGLYDRIKAGIEKATENGEFEYIIHNDENFIEWNKLASAIVETLRNEEFEVVYDDFTYNLTISW